YMSPGFYLDSPCGTCDLTLLRTSGVGVIRGSSHSHSQDELIRVLAGELHFGPHVAGAGMTAAIPADRRYAFRASAPFTFLNYRAGPSSITKGDGVAVRESAESLGWSDLGVRQVRGPATRTGVTDGSACLPDEADVPARPAARPVRPATGDAGLSGRVVGRERALAGDPARGCSHRAHRPPVECANGPTRLPSLLRRRA